MKGQIRPNIMLSNEELHELLQKTGAPAMTMGRLTDIWKALQDATDPVVCYCTFADGHMEAAATLGRGTDDYISGLQAEKRLTDALAADQLCMVLLRKLYGFAEDAMGISPGQYSYAFPEDKNVISAVLGHVEASIDLTESGMMDPVKSTAYILHPVREKDAGCGGLCAACGNRACPYASQAGKTCPDAVRYSYGYQQIFRTMESGRKTDG